MSDSLRPHEPQHAMPLRPSPTPQLASNNSSVLSHNHKKANQNENMDHSFVELTEATSHAVVQGHPRQWRLWWSSDKTWSTGEGNGKPLQYSCLKNRMKTMKIQCLCHEINSGYGKKHSSRAQTEMQFLSDQFLEALLSPFWYTEATSARQSFWGRGALGLESHKASLITDNFWTVSKTSVP